MQRVLTFTHNKKKYISKPYCFKVAVMIQERLLAATETGQRKYLGVNSVCGDAVDYLFEGTEATVDILEEAVSAKMRMCQEVFNWYNDDYSGKNDETPLPGKAEKETEN